MPTPADILLIFVLPALIVGAASAFAVFLSRQNHNARWPAPIAISFAFAFSFCNIGGAPHWPPGSGDAAYWLVWFTIPAALLGLLDAFLRPPTWLRAILFLLLSIAAIKAMAHPLGLAGTSATFVALWAAAATVCWLSWESLAARQSGPLVPILLILTLGSAGAVLGLSDNVKPSQAAVALGGMAIAMTIAALIWKKIPLDRGAMPALLTPLLGLFLFAHLYSYTEPPTSAVALILLAPVIALIADLPRLRRGPWAMILVPVVLTLAAAVALTIRQAQQSQTNQSQQPGPGDY